MVHYQRTLDRTLHAISDGTRRSILEKLSRGPATISQLAEPFGFSLTGLKKHIHILEEAELVTTEKRGRSRECRLGPARLDDAASWIERHRRDWDERLDRADDYLQELQEKGEER